MFHSDTFAKMRFMEKTLPNILDHWHDCQMTRCWNLDGCFTTDEGSPWPCTDGGDLKVKLTRETRSRHRGKLLPPKTSDQKRFFARVYTTNVFNSFVHLLPWSDLENYCHCSHVSDIIKGDIQPPKDCWICHNTACHKLLPVSSTSVSLEQTQPPLFCIRLPNSGGPFRSLVNNSEPGEPLCPGSVWRKGHKASVTRVKPPV